MIDALEGWLSLVQRALNFELFAFAGTGVTVLTLLTLLVVLLLTRQVSRVAQQAITRAAIRRGMSADDGSIAVAQRLVHYAVLLVGAFVGLQSLGIDLGALLAAGAVFAVGVGLALQNLAQNFVSGVILLVEQTIKPGDVVEVEHRTVRVVAMGIRSTVCRTRDGEDLIIPNSVLVQGIVNNLTMNDRVIRVRMPVGIHYGSDLERARTVLLEAARALTWRIGEREPILLLLGFGPSAVEIEISVWASDPWLLPQLRTDLAFAVWNALREAEITIAYPQVDVHVDEPTVRALAVAAGQARS